MAGIVGPVHVWDATDYRANSRAQLALAQEFLTRIAIPPEARVLDIGCGDGKVTALIRAASVTGCDRSPEMVALATREHPECTFVVGDVRELPFDAAFDVAVSFTALHWVVDGHVEALSSVRRALVPGGRCHLQFPGDGNMARLTAAAAEVNARPAWSDAFAGFVFPWFMPSLEVYRPMVEASGLQTVRLELLPRDVVHEGESGLAGWIRTTWMPYTGRLPEARRAAWIDEVVTRYAEQHPPDAEGRLHVPSFRIELEAVRADDRAVRTETGE
jgi:trans-aconitate 2-methyltransferase